MKKEKTLEFIDPNTHEFTLYALDDIYSKVFKLEKVLKKVKRRNTFLTLVIFGTAYYLYSKKNKKENPTEEINK